MNFDFNFRPHLATFWRSGSSSETTSKQESDGKDGNEPSVEKESSKAADAAVSQEDNKMAEENTKLQAALKEYEVKTCKYFISVVMHEYPGRFTAFVCFRIRTRDPLLRPKTFAIDFGSKQTTQSSLEFKVSARTCLK